MPRYSASGISVTSSAVDLNATSASSASGAMEPSVTRDRLRASTLPTMITSSTSSTASQVRSISLNR